MKIYQVNQVTVFKQSENPLTLVIHAQGLASSTGWTNPVLDPSEDQSPQDAVFEYAFAATPPGDISLPVLTPISATLVLKPKRSVDAVVVNARSNSLTVHASEFMSSLAALARDVLPRPITTLAIGEEGATWRFGEEGVTTRAIGEEHPPTWLRGEGPTTLRLGEEGPITDPRLDDPIDPIGGGLGGPFGAV